MLFLGLSAVIGAVVYSDKEKKKKKMESEAAEKKTETPIE